jgi:hypothetical protein
MGAPTPPQLSLAYIRASSSSSQTRSFTLRYSCLGVRSLPSPSVCCLIFQHSHRPHRAHGTSESRAYDCLLPVRLHPLTPEGHSLFVCCFLHISIICATRMVPTRTEPTTATSLYDYVHYLPKVVRGTGRHQLFATTTLYDYIN